MVIRAAIDYNQSGVAILLNEYKGKVDTRIFTFSYEKDGKQGMQVTVKRMLESRNRANWLLKLGSLAKEKWLLLLLKAKYSGKICLIEV